MTNSHPRFTHRSSATKELQYPYMECPAFHLVPYMVKSADKHLTTRDLGIECAIDDANILAHLLLSPAHPEDHNVFATKNM